MIQIINVICGVQYRQITFFVSTDKQKNKQQKTIVKQIKVASSKSQKEIEKQSKKRMQQNQPQN